MKNKIIYVLKVNALVVFHSHRLMYDFLKHFEHTYSTHDHLLGGQEGCLGVFNDW